MKNDLSPRDWQNLSAYLDHRLTPADKQRLEVRLKAEPTLQASLQELERSIVILRSAPRVRAPRKFTLTQEMIGRRQVSPVFPILRLASALASVLFVIVLTAELIWGLGFQPASQQAESLQMESTQVTEMGIEAAEMAVPIEDVNVESSAPELRAAAPETETALPPAAKMLLQPSPAPLQAETFTLQSTDETEVGAWSTDDHPETRTSQPTIPPWRVVHVVEIILILIAIAAGTAAYYSKKRGSN